MPEKKQLVAINQDKPQPVAINQDKPKPVAINLHEDQSVAINHYKPQPVPINLNSPQPPPAMPPLYPAVRHYQRHSLPRESCWRLQKTRGEDSGKTGFGNLAREAWLRTYDCCSPPCRCGRGRCASWRSTPPACPPDD